MYRTVVIENKMTAGRIAEAIDTEANRMEAQGWELKASAQTLYGKTLLTFWRPDEPDGDLSGRSG